MTVFFAVCVCIYFFFIFLCSHFKWACLSDELIVISLLVARLLFLSFIIDFLFPFFISITIISLLLFYIQIYFIYIIFFILFIIKCLFFYIHVFFSIKFVFFFLILIIMFTFFFFSHISNIEDNQKIKFDFFINLDISQFILFFMFLFFIFDLFVFSFSKTHTLFTFFFFYIFTLCYVYIVDGIVWFQLEDQFINEEINICNNSYFFPFFISKNVHINTNTYLFSYTEFTTIIYYFFLICTFICSFYFFETIITLLSSFFSYVFLFFYYFIHIIIFCILITFLSFNHYFFIESKLGGIWLCERSTIFLWWLFNIQLLFHVSFCDTSDFSIFFLCVFIIDFILLFKPVFYCLFNYINYVNSTLRIKLKRKRSKLFLFFIRLFSYRKYYFYLYILTTLIEFLKCTLSNKFDLYFIFFFLILFFILFFIIECFRSYIFFPITDIRVCGTAKSNSYIEVLMNKINVYPYVELMRNDVVPLLIKKPIQTLEQQPVLMFDFFSKTQYFFTYFFREINLFFFTIVNNIVINVKSLLIILLTALYKSRFSFLFLLFLYIWDWDADFIFFFFLCLFLIYFIKIVIFLCFFFVCFFFSYLYTFLKYYSTNLIIYTIVFYLYLLLHLFVFLFQSDCYIILITLFSDWILFFHLIIIHIYKFYLLIKPSLIPWFKTVEHFVYFMPWADSRKTLNIHFLLGFIKDFFLFSFFFSVFFFFFFFLLIINTLDNSVSLFFFDFIIIFYLIGLIYMLNIPSYELDTFEYPITKPPTWRYQNPTYKFVFFEYLKKNSHIYYESFKGFSVIAPIILCFIDCLLNVHSTLLLFFIIFFFFIVVCILLFFLYRGFHNAIFRFLYSYFKKKLTRLLNFFFYTFFIVVFFFFLYFFYDLYCLCVFFNDIHFFSFISSFFYILKPFFSFVYSFIYMLFITPINTIFLNQSIITFFLFLINIATIYFLLFKPLLYKDSYFLFIFTLLFFLLYVFVTYSFSLCFFSTFFLYSNLFILFIIFSKFGLISADLNLFFNLIQLSISFSNKNWRFNLFIFKLLCFFFALIFLIFNNLLIYFFLILFFICMFFFFRWKYRRLKHSFLTYKLFCFINAFLYKHKIVYLSSFSLVRTIFFDRLCSFFFIHPYCKIRNLKPLLNHTFLDLLYELVNFFFNLNSLYFFIYKIYLHFLYLFYSFIWFHSFILLWIYKGERPINLKINTIDRKHLIFEFYFYHSWWEIWRDIEGFNDFSFISLMFKVPYFVMFKSGIWHARQGFISIKTISLFLVYFFDVAVYAIIVFVTEFFFFLQFFFLLVLAFSFSGLTNQHVFFSYKEYRHLVHFAFVIGYIKDDFFIMLDRCAFCALFFEFNRGAMIKPYRDLIITFKWRISTRRKYYDRGMYLTTYTWDILVLESIDASFF